MINIPFITIDPGITGTGWAYFNPKYQQLPITYNNVYPAVSLAKEDHTVRSTNVVQQLIHEITTITKASSDGINTVYIEKPSYMGGAKHYTGQVAAQSGSLVKLVFHYGRIWQAFSERNFKIIPIPVSKWKGQLPKDISHIRIKQIMKRLHSRQTKLIEDHSLDAVGIGFYLLGVV